MYMKRFVTILGAIACSAIADDAFFKYEVDFQPGRSYFLSGKYKMSDTEYHSLQPARNFLPIILETWPQQTLGKQFFGQKAPKFTTDASIKHLWNFLLTNEDPLARSYLINKLAVAENQTGANLLKDLLAGDPAQGRPPERDTYVTADILKALRILNNPPTPVTAYFQFGDQNVRRQAILLYRNQPQVDTRVLLKALAEESHPLVIETLWDGLEENNDQSTIDDWTPRWSSPDPVALAQAVGVAVRYKTWLAHHYTRLSKLAADGHPLVQRAIADNIAGDVDEPAKLELLRQLSAAPNPSVRAAVAAAIDRLQLTVLEPELLALSRDARPIVRRDAATALGAMLSRRALERLVELCGDPDSELARDAAVDTLELIAGNYPVDAEVGEFIENTNADIRYNLYRLLDRLKSSRHNAIVRSHLHRLAQDHAGERPINIAAAIRALATGGDRDATSDIITFRKHDDDGVREAVAYMVGKLKPAQGTQILSYYVLNDKNRDVRKAAFQSIDATKGPHFEDALLTVMKRTTYGGREFLSATDRLDAAWILSHIPIGDATRSRLKAQITDMVIQTPLGPTYDGSNVRAACLWTLAVHTKRNPGDQWLSSTTRELIGVLGRDTTARSTGIPTSYNLSYYAYQADQFLKDAPIERRIVRPRPRRFNYQPVKKKR